MMRAGLLLFMAVVAASLGAPPTVSAAPNELHDPAATPGSGTTSTVFTFSVRYEGRFEATSVVAAVAGRTLPLTLSSGSRSSGTWTGASTLPAGTWPVTFSATAAQGPTATAVGPTLSVASPTPVPVAATPAPAPPATPEAEDEPASGGSSPTGTRTDTTDGVAGTAESGGAELVAESTDPTTGSDVGDGAPSEDDGASGSTPGDDDPTERASASSPQSPGTDAPADDGLAADEAADASPADGVAVEPVGDEREAGTRHSDPDAIVTLVLVVGLAGVAAVAILGSLVLLAGARRRRRGEEDRAAAEPARSPAVDVAARVVERRALRHARTHVGDDPITAALGVDDEMAARRARRAGAQVNRGPGERVPPRRH